ncbi:MAG: FkbM family methyltransferase [Pseudomonadales bacterium]|nr:FkbM family methyltransferase [Pseudomonadales bacterium]
MKFSVITPSFNQAQFLSTNLESVRSQLLVDVEHIVVDPGSTDGSTELARSASGVKLIAEPDRGQSDGISKGFSIATGDILCWLNSDDYYPDELTLNNVASVFNEHSDVDIVYGGVDFVDEQGEFLRIGYVNDDENNLGSAFEYQVGIVQPGVFWRRRVFEALGGPSEEFEYCMDYELWVRMAKGGHRWKYVNATLAHHRWWGGMKTSSRRDLSLLEHFKVCLKYFGYIHWQWLDRYADYLVSQEDGVVNHALEVSPRHKSIALGSVVQRFITQDMLVKICNSSNPEELATYEFIKPFLGSSSRYFINSSDLRIVSRHPDDADAKAKVAWHTFTLSDEAGKNYQSYQLPENFDRAFKASWVKDQLLRTEAAVKRMQAQRSGDTCVIVGNGPSLADVNLDLLAGVDTITSNFASISPSLAKHANFLCIVNDLVASQGVVDFNNTKTIKFVPFWLANQINPTASTYYVRATVKPEFATDFVNETSWRSTVSFFNMQLAYALGYTKVLLIGFDHSYDQPEGVSEGDVISQSEDDSNHFDPRYFKDRIWQAADTEKMEEMYILAKSAFIADGRAILNCTIDSRLKIFPQSTLEEELISEERNYPRTLLLDPTPVGNSTATGQIKKTFLGHWDKDRYLQVWLSTNSDLQFHVLDPSAPSSVATPAAIDLPAALEAIKQFEPEVVYFRPADSEPLFTLHERLTLEQAVPTITHMMDDWPERMRVTQPTRYEALAPRLQSVLDRSVERLAISQPMADEYTSRYGGTWTTLANGVESKFSATVDIDDNEDRPFTVRYLGALAEDMTLSSVTEIAKVIDALNPTLNIRFEVFTMDWCQKTAKAHMGDLDAVTIFGLVPHALYEETLRTADALVIAYNFDEKSTRYTRLSLANKLPECLASGTPLLAYGPSEQATVRLLQEAQCAITVTTQDREALKQSFQHLVESRSYANELGHKGQQFATEHLSLERVQKKFMNTLSNATGQKYIYGPFSRVQQAHCDETSVIAELSSESPTATLIDVGAHQGSALAPFLDLGWDVFAFEPDQKNRKILQHLISKHKHKDRVRLDTRCVTNETQRDIAFYTSAQSSGISGLSAFHESHVEAQRVDTVTLTDYFQDLKLDNVEFLKIDTEGHDLFVLQGFPWERTHPEVIECEFEDNKTTSLGYEFNDIADFLASKGYVVYVSEWHPIIRYGIKHDWLGLKEYPCELETDQAWGNLLAFRKQPDTELLRSAIESTTRVHNPIVGDDRTSSVLVDRPDKVQVATPRYFSFGQWLQSKNLTLFRILQFTHWVIRFGVRHPALSFAASISLITLIVLPIINPELRPFSIHFWGAASLSLLSGLALVGVSFVHARLNALTTREGQKRKTLETKLTKELNQTKHRHKKQNTEIDSVTNRVHSVASALKVSTNELSASQHELGAKWQAQTDEMSGQLDSQRELIQAQKEQIDALNAVLQEQVSQLEQLSTQRHRANRNFNEDHLKILTSEWSQLLDIELTPSILTYMGERAALVEQKCRGRIATPLENLMLRIVCAFSFRERPLHILEIGTLFGIGLAAIYDAIHTQTEKIHMTAIDPLDGYYGNDSLDILTGEPVSRYLLNSNMQAVGISDEDFTLIQKLSTDPTLDLGSQLYDLVIIDGDHSYEGAKFDFELVRDKVADGGLVLFDDYDAPEWPEVKAYVDEIVTKDEAFTLVGSSFRTAVFRKI